MKTRKQTIAVHKETSQLFYGLVFLFALILILYIYFVSISVSYVVMSKDIESNISEITASMSSLESEYIERQHTMSSDIAFLHGFVVAEKKIFIDKTEEVLVLSRN